MGFCLAFLMEALRLLVDFCLKFFSWVIWLQFRWQIFVIVCNYLSLQNCLIMDLFILLMFIVFLEMWKMICCRFCVLYIQVGYCQVVFFFVWISFIGLFVLFIGQVCGNLIGCLELFWSLFIVLMMQGMMLLVCLISIVFLRCRFLLVMKFLLCREIEVIVMFVSCIGFIFVIGVMDLILFI